MIVAFCSISITKIVITAWLNDNIAHTVIKKSFTHLEINPSINLQCMAIAETHWVDFDKELGI